MQPSPSFSSHDHRFAIGSTSKLQTNKALAKKRAAKTVAKAKGLSYVSDTTPGFSRQKRGKYFIYLDTKGRRITQPATLQRIRKLAIPPAYTNVWICPQPHGHLQATGIDARGRKQYRYHANWRSTRDANKFKRMCEFGALLPKLRAQVARDLRLPGLPRQKVLALVVTLLQSTLIRIGNNDYVRQNDSYGLTTLRDRHVRFVGRQKVQMKFRGKSGKGQAIELSDARIARILRRCQDLPGQQLFQYVDEAGEHQPVDSSMVNDYLLAIMGKASDGTGFTAKDFRTWGATVHAIQLLAATPYLSQKTEVAHVIAEVCNAVSARLGNTPAVCRKSYINPWVFTAWSGQVKPKQLSPGDSRNSQERYALRLLKLQRQHEQTL
jgi:DNA topoisomerase IB